MKLKNLMRPIYLVRRANYKFYEHFHSDEPWIAQTVIRYLDKCLTEEMVGLEWGSGRSTRWFASRLRHLISIEHDEKWYERVRPTLPNSVDYRLILLNHPIGEHTLPHYDVTPDYVSVATELTDETLDFVLVDGHYRQACVLAVLPKIKCGGLLVIDNSNWLSLAEWGVPSDWRIVLQGSNVMTQTTVWEKPLTSSRTHGQSRYAAT